MPRDVASCNSSAKRYDFSGRWADEGDGRECHVDGTVQVERNQPRMSCVNKSLRGRCAHCFSNRYGPREMLVEVDVEDVVDEAIHGDAIVTHVKMVHEHEMHAGELSHERPTRGVAEDDGGARRRHILHEGRIFVAHVLLPVRGAAGTRLRPVARRSASAVDRASERLARIECGSDSAVALI